MKRLKPLTLASLAAMLAIGTIAGLASSMVSPPPAVCLEPELCRPQQTRMDDHGLLRAASLDVRGVVATPEEHARISAGEDFEVLLDEWLASPEFQARVVRRHRDLIWPNITNQTRLYHFRRNLSPFTPPALPGETSERVWAQRTQSTRLVYRGENVDCLDEPATFDADGMPNSQLVDGAQREGYVMVEPYWAPGTAIKVCAFDAMEQIVSPSGTDCTSREAIGDPGCGCGPNLRYCGTTAVRTAVLESFAEELEHRVAAHIEAGEPYHRLLTSRRAFVNGPLAYYWRYAAENYNNVSLLPAALDIDGMPETEIDATGGVAFADRDEWTEMELPEQHSGLLTHPVYLLRFQTNRARANRFYNAFLCEPFQPPEGGIPLDDDVAAAQPDVQLRPGCNYCHALLEPAAAHWGRWTQQGGGFLEPQFFPEFRQECADCGRGQEACSSVCNSNYIVRALSPEEEPNLGTLRAYEFLRSEHRPNVEAGPSALVAQGLADGRFSACSVRRTTEWLVGRELRDEEEPWVDELTTEFLERDFLYRDLVRAIVLSDTYRRAL